ncbi:hypothetical protein P152DRAFT_455567 [Eremomyces bilateralis CBS 781.70]|uniref:Alpha-taxilin n=1 Tax=Eremomyces bilateralis CBS 781.70 TaxID=1392243 RepID=A0A6G1GCV2_9PEZI|nr:uncharacterized protein P152DRAFT_455567 [Eremomyces bilateralis CBS 781.70]KAF1815853.1 hypothetical protein P152DRAFT_455567 [Eremomyces bilateralis CBS 781.70]
MPPSQASAGAVPAKAKTAVKGNPDPIDASKQIAAKIAQLELETAGEKDQDAEIDREVRKANRELSHLLANIETSSSRLDTVRDKYVQLLGDMKRLEREHQKSKKRADLLQKERDTARSDLTKANTLKDKFAKMSRENVTENKRLKLMVDRLQGIEANHRTELHQRLDRMISEVDEVCKKDEHGGQDAEVTTEDPDFRQKFKSFVEQYELRELQFISLLRTKELELQYQMARLEQQRKAQEVESSKSHQLTRQVSTFSQTETELRSQLNIYVEKFKQVEDTLNSSNDLFLTFRKEMEDMSKKTKRLEKENHALTRKQEATNRNILEMAEERTRLQQELDLFRKKNDNLEKLCRGMQAQGRGQIPVHDTTEEEDDDDEDEDDDDEDEDEDGTESEYDYEEDDALSEGEYDDDTEEEPAIPAKPVLPTPSTGTTPGGPNGRMKTNGVKH